MVGKPSSAPLPSEQPPSSPSTKSEPRGTTPPGSPPQHSMSNNRKYAGMASSAEGSSPVVPQIKVPKKNFNASSTPASKPGLLARAVRMVWDTTPKPIVVQKLALDKDGDMMLTIRSPKYENNVITVQVSSNSLRIASPVWADRMAKGRKVKELKFQDESDDVEALLFVLRTAHLKHADLPDQLTFDEVVKLAVVCETYNTVAIVKPFVQERIDNFATSPAEMSDGSLAPAWYLAAGNEEWAYVAWTFGFKADFVELVKHLVRTGQTDSDGNLLNFRGELIDGNFPPTLIDFILQSRADCVSRLLDTTYSFFKRLLRAKKEDYPPRLPAQKDDSPNPEDENEMALEVIDINHHIDKVDEALCLARGSFARDLTKLDLLMERPAVATVHQSVEKLAAMLRDMNFRIGVPGSAARGPADITDEILHDLFWNHIVDGALTGLPDTVPDIFLEHMADQAAK